MHVLEYLKEHSLEQLTMEHEIIISYYTDRIVLNYNQLGHHKFSPIVKECRGLILTLPDYRILCRPFDRFFNYNEDPQNKNFPMERALCFEKVDGSLINVYHDGEKWCASTRKMAFAEGPTRMGHTFLWVFEKALGQSINEMFQHVDFNKNLTYSFELVSPETRVVKTYAETAAYLLNIRQCETGQDLANDEIEAFSEFLKIKRPKMYYFNSFENIFKDIGELPAMDEGYVAYVPELNWRIKIKNPSYLAIAHLRQGDILSTKRIIQLVFSGDYGEYLQYFEEDRELFQPYINAFNTMVDYVNTLWEKTKHIVDRKSFALVIKGKAQGLLFGLKDGKNFSEILDSMTLQGKEHLIMDFLI
jgi:T4 RnlA family RNA ligase